jgi:hypothetical protein
MIELAHSDPHRAAVLARSLILDAAHQSTALVDKVATGGVLKLYEPNGGVLYSLTKFCNGSIGSPEIIALSPSLTHKNLKVQFRLPDIQEKPFYIYDVLGRIVFKGTFKPVPGSDYTQTLDISPLPAGVYFIGIEDGSKLRTRRFVKVATE